MSEHIDEQISEFIDDEMPVEECEFFVRRLQRDADAKARYARYHLIGTVLRGEQSGASLAGLGEPGEAAQQGGGARPDASGLRAGSRAAVGWGIAASIALVAVVGFRFASDPAGDAITAGIGDAAGSADADTPAVIEPAAADTFALAPVRTEVAGIQYLMHHASYSSGLNRTIMRSSVVAGLEGED